MSENFHSFKKYEHNPVMGGPDIGTCFDVYATRENGRSGHAEYIGLALKDGRELFSDNGI